jgi:hypothetical protein
LEMNGWNERFLYPKPNFYRLNSVLMP